MPNLKPQGELVWLRLVILGSLCIQCYILSVYCYLRKAIRVGERASPPDYTPRSQISRTEAAEAFSVFSFCCCFFNFYAATICQSITVYAQQRGFLANIFPIFWGLMTLAVASPKQYHLETCLKSYCRLPTRIQYVWQVQIGQIVLQGIFFLLFVTHYPYKRPSPSLDDPAVVPDRHPAARNDEAKSIHSGDIPTVSSRWSDHFKLFLVATTSPLWFVVDFCWLWMTICVPRRPYGTPRRSAHVANEFYCLWYFSRIGAPPGLKFFVDYIVNPTRYGLFNIFWGLKFKLWRSKVDKAFDYDEHAIDEEEKETKLEKMEEGRSVYITRPQIPVSMVRVEPRVSMSTPGRGYEVEVAEAEGTARHEMDATPNVSEVAGSTPGYPRYPELAHTPSSNRPSNPWAAHMHANRNPTPDYVGYGSAVLPVSPSTSSSSSGQGTGSNTSPSIAYSPRRYAPASSPQSPVEGPLGSVTSPASVNQGQPTTPATRASPTQGQEPFAPSPTSPTAQRSPSPYIVSPVGTVGRDWNPWGLEHREGSN